MIAKAKIKYLRISPKKLRLLLPLIRNKTVPVALSILENTNKKAASYIYKAVYSAAANAKRLPNVGENDLYISRIFADGGPMLKRYKARAMGMAATIRKRSCHLTVELDTLTPVPKVSAGGGPASGRKKVSKLQKKTVGAPKIRDEHSQPGGRSYVRRK